jgi:hypothetical protein
MKKFSQNPLLQDLVKELAQNKIKVYLKKDGPDTLLWCNYGEHTKQRTGQGFEIWGEAARVKENITGAVLKRFPNAEITSEAARAHVVYRLNG